MIYLTVNLYNSISVKSSKLSLTMERWGAKLIALFITFISILITTLLPIKLYAVVTRFGAKGEHLVGCLMCFSGGVFLGAYMLHMAPEVRNLFDEALFHPNRITYPVADCVMVVGFFMMIFFEILVRYLSNAKKRSKSNGGNDPEDDDTSLDNDDVFVSGHYRYMGARKRSPHETLGERFDRLANENHQEELESSLGPQTRRNLLSSMSSLLPNRWTNQSADSRCPETPSLLNENCDVGIQQVMKKDRPKLHLQLLGNLPNYEEFSEKTETCYLHAYEEVCTCVDESPTDMKEGSVNRLTMSSVCTKISTADSGMRGSGNDLRSEETLSSQDNSEVELRERNYDKEESTDLEVFEISRCINEQDSASIDSANSKMSKDSLEIVEKKPCKETNRPSDHQVVSEKINEQINEQNNEQSRLDQVHYEKKRVRRDQKLNTKCKNCCKQRIEGSSVSNFNYDNRFHTKSSPKSPSSSGIITSPTSPSSPGFITSPLSSRVTSRVSVDSLLQSPVSDSSHSRRTILSHDAKPRGKTKHVTIDSPIKTPHIFGYQLIDGVRIPLLSTSKHTQDEVEYEVKSANSLNRISDTVPRHSLNSEEGRRSKSERKRSSCQLVEETTSCRRYKMMKLVGNKQTDRTPSGSDKVDVEDTNHRYESKSHSQDTRSLTLLLALSMHNVFEGLSVGLKHSVNAVWNMCIAVIAHEIIISFGLGMQMVRTYSSMRRLVFSAVLCSSMVPLGIIVGLIMTETGALVHHSRTSLLTNGALQGLATGVFIYVTFFEILRGEMGHGKAGMDKMFFMMFGFIALALLALLPEDNPMTLHNEEVRPCVQQLVTGSAPNITK